MFFRAPGFPELSALGIPRPPDPLRNGAIPPPTSFMPPAIQAPLTPKVFKDDAIFFKYYISNTKLVNYIKDI